MVEYGIETIQLCASYLYYIIIHLIYWMIYLYMYKYILVFLYIFNNMDAYMCIKWNTKNSLQPYTVMILSSQTSWALLVYENGKQLQIHQVYPVNWGCRIYQLHLCRAGKTTLYECPGYGTKWSDGEAPVILELWEMWSTPSLPCLPGPFWPRMAVPDRALSMG